MFTEFIPTDRPTAFLEIGIILLITFVLGFLCGKIPLATKKTVIYTPAISTDTIVEDRDIITEPTTIRATLTRKRGGTLANNESDMPNEIESPETSDRPKKEKG